MNDLLRQTDLRPCPVEDVLVRDGDGWRFKDGVQYSFCNSDGITFTSGGDPTILNGAYFSAHRLCILGEPAGAWTDGRRCVVPFPGGFHLSSRASDRHVVQSQPAILVVCRDLRDADSGRILRETARPFGLWREDAVRR